MKMIPVGDGFFNGYGIGNAAIQQFKAFQFPDRQTRAEGRKRNYIITYEGKAMLKEEYQRLQKQMQDYEQFMREEEGV